jgi:hypothetical protein
MRGVLRAAQQVHRFFPAGELCFGQNHDVAFSALAADEQWLPIVCHTVEPGRHGLAQVAEEYVGHSENFRRIGTLLRAMTRSIGSKRFEGEARLGANYRQERCQPDRVTNAVARGVESLGLPVVQRVALSSGAEQFSGQERSLGEKLLPMLPGTIAALVALGALIWSVLRYQQTAEAQIHAALLQHRREALFPALQVSTTYMPMNLW